MTATDIMAIRAARKGEKVVSTWDDSWSNFTADEIRKFENECESKFNTESEVNACVEEKKRSGRVGGGLNLGSLFNTGAGLVQTYRDNKQYGSGTYNTTPVETKNNTGLYIGLGVLAVVGVGVAIYFIRKNS